MSPDQTKIVLCGYRDEPWKLPAWFADRLRDRFPHCRVVVLLHESQTQAEIVDADVFFSWSLRPELFAQARKLRWIHSPAAAVNQLLFPELAASAVQITNSSQVHGPVVAQHAMALIFAMARRLDAAMQLQQNRGWMRQHQLWEERPKPREVSGSVLGLVGLGSIGNEVARLAKDAGMQVLAIREHPDHEHEFVDEVRGTAELPWLLSHSDFVVLTAPLTVATTNLINAGTLAHFRPEANLINVSRGALIDEAALCQALDQGTIGGAALDVFVTEPLPPESPLWKARNLLITPHAASMTGNQWERQYALFSNNLECLLSGKPLHAVIDKAKGY